MTPVPRNPPTAAIVRPPGRSFARALSGSLIDRGTPSGFPGPLPSHRGTPSGFPGPLPVHRGTPSGFPGPLRAWSTIDPARAAAQHAAYVAALADLIRVVPLPVLEDLPDSCFVDDCAVVLGDRALLTRPGAPSRAEEPERLLPALAALVADVQRMTPAGTRDGGVVVRLDRTLVVGGSRRTNRAGVEQLARFARSCGLEVAVATVPDGVLHLQTEVTALAGDAVVGSAFMLAQPVFRSVRRRVVVPPEETQGCNVLSVGTTAVLPP